MTSTAHVQETVQEQEERLWSQYLMAELDVERIHLQYEKVWRLHVMCHDTETGGVWLVLLNKWKSARNHATEMRQEWKQAAYPLYGWRLPDDK